jgi:hypothetical protein
MQYFAIPTPEEGEGMGDPLRRILAMTTAEHLASGFAFTPGWRNSDLWGST